jgi:hypothetical protein
MEVFSNIPREATKRACNHFRSRLYTVTRTTQNEAVLWISAGLGMKKPPVGAGTFCHLPILIFYFLPCWKYRPVSGAGPSPCCYRKNSVRTSNYKCQKKLPEIHRMGRGSPGLRHFQQISNKVKWLLSLCFIDYHLFLIDFCLVFINYCLLFIDYRFFFIDYHLFFIDYLLFFIV